MYFQNPLSRYFIVPQYLYSQIENTVNLVVIILQAALSECVPKTFDVSLFLSGNWMKVWTISN